MSKIKMIKIRKEEQGQLKTEGVFPVLLFKADARGHSDVICLPTK